uniref:CCHC-type domain-containing protein n=1 Tax=Manihot esculenta TaxID=3983 RepID=A0A2C9WG94_MANES
MYQLLCLAKQPPDKLLDELSFDECPFWIQIQGLLPNHMTLANAKTIGNFIGNFIDYDLTFNRVVGITRVIHWIKFQFKKLPDFCFNCDIIGHLNKECSSPA